MSEPKLKNAEEQLLKGRTAKRVVKVAGLSLFAICALTVCVVVGMFFFALNEKTSYMSRVSPSGAYKVELEYSAGFGFGPHTIYVYGRRMPNSSASKSINPLQSIRSRKQHLLTFSLYNDGANLTEYNCDIDWQTVNSHEVAVITCGGQEQSDETYRIDFVEELG